MALSRLRSGLARWTGRQPIQMAAQPVAQASERAQGPASPMSSEMLAALVTKTRNLLGAHYDLAYPQPYSPDELRATRDPLLARKGLEIYGEIARDDMVDLGLSLLISVLVPAVRVEPAGDTAEDKWVADKTTRQLERMTGSATKKVGKILQALMFGFSASEMCFGLVTDDNEDRGDAALTDIKYRLPYSFDFKGNRRTGDLERMLQVDLYGSQKSVEIDRRKIIHFVVNDHVDPFRGMSIYRPAHWAWWGKQQFIPMRGIQAERLNGKLEVAHDDVTKLNPNDFDAVAKAILDSYQNSAGWKKPPGMSTHVVTGEASPSIWTDLITACDRVLLRPTKIPWLMVQEGIDSGSYALAEVQERVMTGGHAVIRADLEEKLSERHGPAWWICELNGWSHRHQSKIKLSEAIERDRVKRIELINTCVAGGTLTLEPQDRNFIRTGLGLARIDEHTGPQPAKTFAESSDRWWERPLTAREKRFKMAGSGKGLDIILERAKKAMDAQWEASIAALQHKVEGWVHSEKVSPREILKRIRDAGMDLDGFEAELVEAGVQSWMLGGEQAAKELQLAGATSIAKPPALKFDSKVAPDNPFDLGNFKALLQARAFEVRRGYEEKALSAIADALANAYQAGLSPSDASKRLDEIFKGLAAGHMIEPGTPGHDYTKPAVQETTVRTVGASAFNSARQDLFQRNSDFVTFVEISEVASGHDGDRSHPLSQYLHGLRIGMKDPRLKQLLPPNHFSDRGVAIPGTILDDQALSTDFQIDFAIRKKKALSPRFA